MAEVDETLIKGWPEQKLLARIKRLVADAYLDPSCVRDGDLIDPSPVPLFIHPPDRLRLEQWLERRYDSGERLEALAFQLSGVTGGLDLGEGAPRVEAQKVSFPLSTTAGLADVYEKLKLDSLARDRVGYSVLDLVLLPRTEPVEGSARSEEDTTRQNRYVVYPASFVPARVLDETVVFSAEKPHFELTLRAWKDELERAGVHLLQILQDNETADFKDNYLEAKEYTYQEVRAFDLVLARQLEPLIYSGGDEEQGEFSFWQVLDRFWEEYRKKAEVVRERDKASQAQ